MWRLSLAKKLASYYPNLRRFTAMTCQQKLRDFLQATCIASSSFINTRSIMMKLCSTLLSILIRVAFKFCKKIEHLHTLTYVDSLSGPPLQKLCDFSPASRIASSSFIKAHSIMMELCRTLLHILLLVAFKFCKKNPGRASESSN